MKNILRSIDRRSTLHGLRPSVVWLAILTCSLSICSVLTGPLSAEDAPQSDEQLIARGKQIYHTACAQCHGDQGQGVAKAYGEPLIGDATLGELTETINDTMPEEDPEQCVGEDARAVAKYIYETFYSEAAQIRNRPPRVILAHLTGNQLRQSLSDVYAHFSGGSDLPKERGVKAIYFTGDRWKNENKKIERTDAQLQFDFKHDGPGEGIDPKSFISTGKAACCLMKPGVTKSLYEAPARSAWTWARAVASSSTIMFNPAATLSSVKRFTLTAGRMYPVKIDFRQRERKTELPPAQFSVSWIPRAAWSRLSRLRTGFLALAVQRIRCRHSYLPMTEPMGSSEA